MFCFCFLALVWGFFWLLLCLWGFFYFLTKIWFNSFNYFLSSIPEVQTLSWLGNLKSHMVLLSPGKASFNLANWIVSYFLFCYIFSNRNIDSALNGKKKTTWPVKPALGVVRKKEENKQLCSECGKALLWVLKISITTQARCLCPQKLVRNSAFSQSG